MPRFSLLPVVILLLAVCQVQAYDVLCHNGDTGFHAEFRTGVIVSVGPPTQAGLAAARVCRATLSWNNQEVVVADRAEEVDLDLFGVDLGLGEPVAAFQLKNSAAECCQTYKIYSLQPPPRLLRTLTGGIYFSARDSNLDGRVEIWTDDAAAVNGLEGLRASELQYPPACVLRFDGGQLLDVSSEFQPFFDDIVTKIRAEMNPAELAQFRLGKPAAPQLPAVKKQVLELVWSYLYSGREKQAWQTLADMWPAADVKRIRSALERARGRGLRSQVDGSLHTSFVEEQHAHVYDFPEELARPIVVRYYPPKGKKALNGKLRLTLIVDFAGKVWSVKVAGRNKAAGEYVKDSSANWKFVPAFDGNNSVASRVHMTISLAQ